MADNCLYYGDNLGILRRYIKDETVDLIYLDPPFNSKATYNILFGEQNASEAAAQQTVTFRRGPKAKGEGPEQLTLDYRGLVAGHAPRASA